MKYFKVMNKKVHCDVSKQFTSKRLVSGKRGCEQEKFPRFMDIKTATNCLATKNKHASTFQLNKS